ncbi:MAG TPA: hypothetical protein VGD50_05160 [Candidatus Baltobacteraceae bacterium]
MLRLRRPTALALEIVFLLGGASAALALPPPAPPIGARTNASAAPSATPGTVLPMGSTLAVVLDDRISSRESVPHSVVRFHLKDPLVVGGVTIADAGTPGSLTVVTAHKAIAPDQDGDVQIALSPLVLGTHGVLPLRPIHEYLTIDRTAGQLTTRDTTDTVADIFLPPYVLYQVMRRGHDFVLPAGTVLRVLTAASIAAPAASVVRIETPAPLKLNHDPIHADFTPIPLATVPPMFHRRKPTPRPTDTSSASPAASATPIAPSLTPTPLTPAMVNPVPSATASPSPSPAIQTTSSP